MIRCTPFRVLSPVLFAVVVLSLVRDSYADFFTPDTPIVTSWTWDSGSPITFPVYLSPGRTRVFELTAWDCDKSTITGFSINDVMNHSSTWSISPSGLDVERVCWVPHLWPYITVNRTFPVSPGDYNITVSGIDDVPYLADDSAVSTTAIFKVVLPNRERTTWLSHYYEPGGAEIGDRFNHEVRFIDDGESKTVDFSGLVIQESQSEWRYESHTVPGLTQQDIQNWIDEDSVGWNSKWTITSQNKRGVYPGGTAESSDAHTLNRVRNSQDNPAWLNQGEVVISQSICVVEPTISGELWRLNIKFVLPGGSIATHVAKQSYLTDGSKEYVICPNIPAE